jgi:hypothetical protein
MIKPCEPKYRIAQIDSSQPIKGVGHVMHELGPQTSPPRNTIHNHSSGTVPKTQHLSSSRFYILDIYKLFVRDFIYTSRFSIPNAKFVHYLAVASQHKPAPLCFFLVFFHIRNTILGATKKKNLMFLSCGQKHAVSYFFYLV